MNRLFSASISLVVVLALSRPERRLRHRPQRRIPNRSETATSARV